MDYASYSRGVDDGRIMASRTPATAPFLVFADAVGYKAPSFKHPTRQSAETEANRLATLNPGVNYYVVGAVSVTSATKPTASKRNLV